jgi:voltage-gated potassium channel
MYYAEHETQPEVFTNMSQSIWWAVATLTTIGYGDIYPVTALGKIIASSLAFVGIGLVAIPAGLISAAYVDEINSQKK